MTGKIIRCLCGTMYDPAQHAACPSCGREPTAPTPPDRKAVPPPVPQRAPERPQAAAGPGRLPSWGWKAGAGAIGVVALAYLVGIFGGDETPGQSPPGAPLPATQSADRQRPASTCAAITGDWSWFTGGYVHFSDDGHAFFKPTEDAPPAITATWTCDAANGDYVVTWSHGFTETIRLYDNGDVVQGTNNIGVDVSGRRYIDPARGMPPLQTVASGSQQLPSGLPQLAAAADTVAANWRPDAYLVGLRIRKDGWPNKDAFYVEFSFFSPSENTGLWISSHRTRSKVREAGTVNWGTQRLPDQFIDLPEAVQTVKKAGFRGLVDRAELQLRGARDGKSIPVWDIKPELHGQGAGQVDAVTGRLL